MAKTAGAKGGMENQERESDGFEAFRKECNRIREGLWAGTLDPKNAAQLNTVLRTELRFCEQRARQGLPNHLLPTTKRAA